jgi:Leucine-rich repeat (LRR) protein
MAIKLEILNASKNMLTSIPVGLCQLSSLKELNLSHNKIKRMPKELKELKALNLVDLSSNQIEEIEDTIEDLNCIELNLNENRVKKISSNISKCPRLKVLRLEQNVLDLNAIPTTLMTESTVSLLSIDGNLFTQKQFEQKDGYESYMERFTATRRKFD